MESKPWYESKELIVAGVGLVAGYLQSKWGWVVSPEYQAYAVVLAMAVLRAFFTKGPVTLKK